MKEQLEAIRAGALAAIGAAGMGREAFFVITKIGDMR